MADSLQAATQDIRCVPLNRLDRLVHNLVSYTLEQCRAMHTCIRDLIGIVTIKDDMHQTDFKIPGSLVTLIGTVLTTLLLH